MTEQVWVLDDDSSIRWVLEKALESADISVASFAAAESLWQAISHEQPSVIVSDVRMPDTDGMELLARIQQHYPDIPVIIITAHSDLDSAVSAYQSGAFEYLPKPFDIDDALGLITRALEHSLEQAKRTRKSSNTHSSTPEIIGEAPAMQEVFRAIGRLASSSISVLINGQSGTGKELVAKALHKHSPRKESNFIALNMAAIPKDLIESELFGHEKGAFTGANSVREGRFEQANGGTLFLDEIGDMPLEVQTRLLRVLADGQFYRVGGHQPVTVDVRIIAATHQDLEQLVLEGEFREDLFHRLNVIRIHIPSLNERREDIPTLAEHFLLMAAKELKVDAKKISKEAQVFMTKLEWPGNVRQLENTCRWLTVMASGQEILINDLPPELTQAKKVTFQNSDWQQALKMWCMEQLNSGQEGILDEAVPEFERTVIDCALVSSAGHKQLAAKKLGWGRNTLTRKLKELDIK